MPNKSIENNKIPVVTILGHVDHGKTSILDKIRNSRLQSKEAGGITQKISVFTVDIDGSQITFVDTPGHEAFDIMRTRGGSIADVVLLVVAANDGVKPQTIESIEIIKNSKATPIVVINKIDLPDVNIEKVKREIVNHGLLLEGLGGDIPVVEVSAKTGAGIEDLLELILLTYKVNNGDVDDKMDIKDEFVLGKAVVLESSKDPKRGNTSTLIVQGGTFATGNFIAYQEVDDVIIERVKTFIDEDGKSIKMLHSGFGGKIIGLDHLLALGEYVFAIKDRNLEKAKELFPSTTVVDTDDKLSGDNEKEVDLSDFFGVNDADSQQKRLPVILKAGSEGALISLEKSVRKLNVDDVTVDIKKSEVGQVTKNDIELASTTKSIILAFGVNWSPEVENLARSLKVVIRKYEIVYKLIEELTEALSVLAMPEEVEEEIGTGVVKKIFVLSNGSIVLGSAILTGVFKKNRKCYVVRNDEIVVEGRIVEIRHLKKEITEAQKNMEVGIRLSANVSDVKEGDELHCFDKVR